MFKVLFNIFFYGTKLFQEHGKIIGEISAMQSFMHV